MVSSLDHTRKCLIHSALVCFQESDQTKTRVLLLKLPKPHFGKISKLFTWSHKRELIFHSTTTFSTIHCKAIIAHYFHVKCSDELHSLHPSVQAFYVRTPHATSMQLNHPYFPCVPSIIRKFQSAFFYKFPLHTRDSQVDISLDNTLLNSLMKGQLLPNLIILIISTSCHLLFLSYLITMELHVCV